MAWVIEVRRSNTPKRSTYVFYCVWKRIWSTFPVITNNLVSSRAKSLKGDNWSTKEHVYPCFDISKRSITLWLNSQITDLSLPRGFFLFFYQGVAILSSTCLLAQMFDFLVIFHQIPIGVTKVNQIWYSLGNCHYACQNFLQGRLKFHLVIRSSVLCSNWTRFATLTFPDRTIFILVLAVERH